MMRSPTLSFLSQLFSRNRFQRGQELLLQGGVTHFSHRHSTLAGDIVTADIVDGDDGSFNVVIHLQPLRQSWRINDHCTCKRSRNCEHVAAAMLALLEKSPAETPSPLAPAQVEPPPLAQLDAPTRHWLQQVEQVNRHQESGDRSEIISYRLALDQTPQGLRLNLAAFRRRLLRSGELGIPQQQSLFTTVEANHIDATDRAIIDLVMQTVTGGRGNAIHLPCHCSGHLLELLIASGRAHWERLNAPPLSRGADLAGELGWVMTADGKHQQLTLQLASNDLHAIPLTPVWYIDYSRHLAGLVHHALPAATMATLIGGPAVAPHLVSSIQRYVDRLPQQPLAPTSPPVETERPLPVPVAQLRLMSWQSDNAPNSTPLHLALFGVRYGDQRLAADTLHHPYAISSSSAGALGPRLWRNRQAEQMLRQQLLQRGLQPPPASLAADLDRLSQRWQAEILVALNRDGSNRLDTWQQLVTQEIPALQQQGWEIVEDGFRLHFTTADAWYGEISEPEGVEWFELDLGIEIGSRRISLLPLLLSLLRQHNQRDLLSLSDDHLLLFGLDDGSALSLPMGRLRPILELLVSLHQGGDRIRLNRIHSLLLADLVEQPFIWGGAEGPRRLAEQLANFTAIASVPPPVGLQANLRSYQQQGLDWLQFLRSYDFGGLLADDMGLGKTLQALAHLLLEKESGRASRPSLVIAPTSLMTNWQREAARFCPTLRLLLLHGSQRMYRRDQLRSYDLVLTTYPLLARDEALLLGEEWHLLILDEAQAIKNPTTRMARVANALKARHRLALTGTPMENHLGELWSIFHFLMPGLLGRRESFQRLFRNPIERQGNSERNTALRRRVAPFMLRRTKEQVAQELPPKSEMVVEVTLEAAQRDLYETVRLALHGQVQQEISSRGLGRSGIVVLDALLKLRQICCDPRLLKGRVSGPLPVGAKLTLLLELVDELLAEGRRILLFSQFTSMLALIEEALLARNIDYVKLTGETRDRVTPIDRFQNGEVPLFLISLKAGGSGLNLTAADSVIHYDPWWNPAVERQATDRAHRIGQEKPVFVYKLITVGTVESRIAELQQRKQALADALFAGGGAASGIDEATIAHLFAPLTSDE
jgi:superfamily II DNA or RNA helicase